MGEGHGDRGLHVGVRGVHEADGLRVGPGEVDNDVAAALRHGRHDADVLPAMPVVVEHGFALEHPVAPCHDDSPRLGFGRVDHRLDRGDDRVRANFRKQLAQALLPEMGGAGHGGEVAPKVAGVAHVRGEKAEQVIPEPPGLVELDRRHAQALLPDLGRVGVVAAVGGAPDIALMRPHHGPEQPALAMENGHERGQVGEMAAAVIGVVEEDDVPGADLGDGVLDGAGREGQCADVIGMWSACATSRQCSSQIAMEKSRLELRICE